METIWSNPFFIMFLVATLIFGVVIYWAMRAMIKKNSNMKLMQQQHVARVDVIRKEHTVKLEKLRTEMLKREEDRSRQWMESERETLRVLSGVSSLLDLSEKIGRVDYDKIITKLEDIEKHITVLKKSVNDKDGSVKRS